MGSWFSNPGTGATGSATVGGGVGKYLKARNTAIEALGNNVLGSNNTSKKRKVDVSGVEYKNFSGW